MDKISHYSVFAAAPGGGKHFAIVEGVSDPLEMQQIAAHSGQPLTGFILEADSSRAELRFFSPKKEKGSSDSGALVVAEHLRRQGAIQDRVLVQMGQEGLEVSYQDGKWWSSQENIRRHERELEIHRLIRALGLLKFIEFGTVGEQKINAAVRLATPQLLNGIQPDFSALGELQKEYGLNGIVVFCGESPFRLRFFSPAKNLNEDNAGSYTVASLFGYLGGKGQLEFIQGEAMGKPSRLYAHANAENGIARNIMVGGKVETL